MPITATRSAARIELLFGRRLPVDDDELEFQLATFKWLTGEFGVVDETPLVLPTAEFFPSIAAGRRSAVSELFDEVRDIAGMADWPCRLEAGESDRPVDAGNAHLFRHEGPSAPCGTFIIDEGPDGRCAVITFKPEMERDPPGLVATFAHELGHYLLASAGSAPPGGWDLHELHTDLAAVYLGFGIFLANSARNFSAGATGWSSSMQGYLSEGALVTALVVFQRLAKRDPLAATPHLKDYLRKDLRRAAAVLAKRYADMSAAVAAVDLADFVRE